jgi:predicted DNA-binding transcriptional regulator AlpA
MELARERAKELSGHTLILLPEAAAMLGGITVKSLREAEARAHDNGDYWPPRVRLTSRLTGYRLADLEAFIQSSMEDAA